MFNKLKNAFGGKEQTQEPKTSFKGTFGGMSEKQIKANINDPTKAGGGLTSARVGEDAKTAMESYKSSESKVISASSSDFSETIATFYSEGSAYDVIDQIRSHLNENKGQIEQKYWYMLMDCYQIINNQENFERVALSFSKAFDTSPPSWEPLEVEVQKSLIGKNILILEQHFDMAQTAKFKDFLIASKQEKFCRINLSQCKFEQSEIAAVKALLDLFTQLRKSKVVSVLMGEANLVSLCKNYVNPNEANPNLNKDFLLNEELFWLISLELLQWSGKQTEFDDMAFEYTVKFEISPPSWDDSGVMNYEKTVSHAESEFDQIKKLDKNVDSSNIGRLSEIINEQFEKENFAEIDFRHVEKIDFTSAGTMSHIIQEIWSDEKHKHKKISIIEPNEMIRILLEMVGIGELVQIVPKRR